MDDFQLVVWSILPPLLLLVYYYRRVPATLHKAWLLVFFVVGAISGFVALGLEWGFEYLLSSVMNWEQIARLLPGVALRQLLEVGPIEEGSKLGGVVLFQSLCRTRSSSMFLCTIAVALGFAAEENWVYLYNGTASIFDRLIGTPVHALFSAPWGYALEVAISSRFRLPGFRLVVARAWINALLCHALVNILSSAWRYLPPLRFLGYGLFPFLLWMFWRMEGLLRRVQHLPPITLISSHTLSHRYWQYGLVLFALVLGGNAIFGFFLLATNLSSLSLSQLLSPAIGWFTLRSLLFNLIPGLLAGGIYKYLRHLANR